MERGLLVLMDVNSVQGGLTSDKLFEWLMKLRALMRVDWVDKNERGWSRLIECCGIAVVATPQPTRSNNEANAKTDTKEKQIIKNPTKP